MKRLLVTVALIAALPAAGAAQPESLQAGLFPSISPEATPAAGPCPVAISAGRASAAHAPGDQIVTYEPPFTPSAAWINDSVLIVPRGCGGRYLLTVAFTKDARAGACTPAATSNDDAHILFFRRPFGQPTAQLLGSRHGAWAGSGHPVGQRVTASYTMVAALDAGDQVTTVSRGGSQTIARCLKSITFSAATLN